MCRNVMSTVVSTENGEGICKRIVHKSVDNVENTENLAQRQWLSVWINLFIKIF